MQEAAGIKELTSVSALKATFCEYLATLLFIVVGVGAVAAFVASSGPNTALADGLLVISVGFGVGIVVLAAGIGSISGGHINPAVTFAMVITGNISVVRGVMYVVAQLAGAATGAAMLRGFLSDDLFLAIPGAGGNSITESVVPSNLAAVGLEAVGTFLLVWTVFAVAVSRKGNAGTLAPLYIGFAVLLAHIILVPLTGCGINPARTFGPALVNGRWDAHWVYWVGPLIGAAVAGLTYTFLFILSDDDEGKVVSSSVTIIEETVVVQP